MKDFDIIEKDTLSALEEPGSVRASLRLVKWTPQPIGWDEKENEPIYGESDPADKEKFEHHAKYRLMLMKHTKPESERTTLADGVAQKAYETSYFDTRDEAALKSALHTVIGSAVAHTLNIE